MTKWIFTGLLMLISTLTFSIVLNDQGSGISDWIELPIIAIASGFAILTTLFWLKAFLKNRKKINLLFILFPFVLAGLHLFLYQETQEKIYKDYFLVATNPDESAHQYNYYFRSDSTLKTNGIYFWNIGNTYQDFSMKGDTIFFDTILPATGIQSKIYLKTIKVDSNNKTSRLLVPLDNNHKPIESLTKFVIKEDKTENQNRH
jgi:hypothetical protein